MRCSRSPAAGPCAATALGLGLGLGLLLAACQPLPRPFAAHELNPLLERPENAGVVVEDVSGLPPELAREYRDAMVAALQEAGILAGAGPGNGASFRLKGAGSMMPPPRGSDPARGSVSWELTDASGRRLAGRESAARLRPGAVARENRGAIGEVVREVAAALEVSSLAAAEPAPEVSPPVAVLPVDGAPGDGRDTLQRALILALRERGMRVAAADKADPKAILVHGDVAVAPVPPNRERVDIAWTVRRAGGDELGRVTQSNTIPAGLLRGRWGQIALAAADGAADGVTALIKRFGSGEGAPGAGDAAKPVYTPGRR